MHLRPVAKEQSEKSSKLEIIDIKKKQKERKKEKKRKKERKKILLLYIGGESFYKLSQPFISRYSKRNRKHHFREGINVQKYGNTPKIVPVPDPNMIYLPVPACTRLRSEAEAQPGILLHAGE